MSDGRSDEVRYTETFRDHRHTLSGLQDLAIMAPKKQKKVVASPAKADTSRSDSQGMDASQDHSSRMNEIMKRSSEKVHYTNVDHMVGGLTTEQTKARRQKRKAEIQVAQRTRVEKLRNKVDQAVQKHEDNL